MTALRKFKAPEVPNAGHRWTWIMSLLEMGIPISGDARLLLFVLVGHDGDGRLVNPGIRRLAMLTGASVGRVMAARDELLEYGLITEDRGSGTRSSVYRLVALDAWFKEWVSVRNPPPSVPDSGSSVHPVQTNPSEPSEPEKEGTGGSEKKVAKMVPVTGWQALKAAVDDHTRIHWLDKLEFIGTDGSGVMVFSTDNPFIAARVREMFDGCQLGSLARSVGVDPAKVAIRTAKHGVDPVPPDLRTVPLTPRGLDDMAQRIEDKPEPPVLSGNAVSLEAYRTRLNDVAREHEVDDGVPVGDAEVARPRGNDEREERQRLDSDSGPGSGGAGAEDQGDSDGV